MNETKNEIYDFLYGNPPTGQPDDNITIGTCFEADRLFEDWGFCVYQNHKPIAYGRTMQDAIINAREFIRSKNEQKESAKNP